MATLKFFLRHSTRGESHLGSICVRIIHARKVKVLTSTVRLYPEEWNDRLQQIILPEEDTDRYYSLCKASEILRHYKDEFEETIGKLEKSGRYSLQDIILGYRYRRSLSSLHGFVELLSRNMFRSGQERTARAYCTTARMLIRFNKGKDIPLKHINMCMIKEFESYLKDCGKAMNTISYYMRMLRAIYRKAVKNKLIEAKRENPFEGVFTGFQQTRKRALDSDKIKQLYSLDFISLLESKDISGIESGSKGITTNTEYPYYLGNKGLYESWRYFFFCFLARGMSFVDMAYLRKENIRHGVISYYRKKTGQKIEITVTSSLQKIIDSFSDEVRNSPYLFPVICSKNKPARIQYESGLNIQNRRLKRLSKIADIGCKITTHVARHSWATIGKKQNLPLWVISEGLGHSSEKMTYTYLASFDLSTLDKANEQIAMAVLNSPTVSTNNYIST
ncbi:site-specific integrase [Dysgonomonas sp. Marseille-P4677]|uniref:site-specific integrase n=1 Tax=Dysgonomonas sp. Marseille-P4677 TaxID=2364790 RepID=UPI0019127F78|nr:site-specific integrase [Dysgonomonas sp. Marseille-P4677]MBK5722592.1 site-specific integrase [Dysgonomonas sp. Marseille-P4677]